MQCDHQRSYHSCFSVGLGGKDIFAAVKWEEKVAVLLQSKKGLPQHMTLLLILGSTTFLSLRKH